MAQVLLSQFLAQNLHFAISLFAALVFFAVFWLYFDAWLNKKEQKELYKWLGALLISLAYLIHATVIEQSVLGSSIFGDSSKILSNIIMLAGYIGFIIGQVIDPLIKEPTTKGLEEELKNESAPLKKAPVVAGVTKSFGTVFVLPFAALIVGLLYLRRVTTGLERHLRPVAIGFFLLAASQFAAMAQLAQNTDNPTIYNLAKAFGPLWIIEHLLLLAGVLVLGHWVWNYLLKRFFSQLFMIFIGVTLIVFLLTTMGFTFLLMHNIQNSALDNLQTASNVLSYAIDSKKAEAKANAEAVAQNPKVIQAVQAKDHKNLAGLTADFLQSKKQSNLVITSSSAQVLLRANDPDRWGDSISSDTLVRKALVGEAGSTAAAAEGVLAPIVSIKSAVPIRDGDNIIGSVTTALLADNGFVDGIKNATGLDSAVYSSSSLSATTLTAPDGKTRQIGVKLNNKSVTNLVLNKGKDFKGPVVLLNRPFLAVFTPLKDVNNNTVGMLFIGQPQSSVLAGAGRSIEDTFLITAILIILSIVPAFLTARYISRQLE